MHNNFFQTFLLLEDFLQTVFLFFDGCLAIFDVSSGNIFCDGPWCVRSAVITGLFCQRIILPGCLSLHNSLPRAALAKSWENIYTSQFCVPGLFSSQIIWEWNNVRGGHNLQRYYTLGHRGCLASGTLPSQKKSTLLAKIIALLQQIPLRLSAKQPHLFFPSNLDLHSTAHILM